MSDHRRIMPQPGTILNSREVADRLGVSVEYVRQLAADGLLRCLTLPPGAGGRSHRRFYESDVQAFIDARMTDEAAS